MSDNNQPNTLCIGSGLVKGQIVKVSVASTEPQTVAKATAGNDALFGITQAASYNDVVPVMLPGNQTLLLLGEDVSANDRLTADANGYGAKAYAGDNIIAKALEDGDAGDLILVDVVQDRLPNTDTLSGEVTFTNALGDYEYFTLPADSILVDLFITNENVQASTGVMRVDITMDATALLTDATPGDLADSWTILSPGTVYAGGGLVKLTVKNIAMVTGTIRLHAVYVRDRV